MRINKITALDKTLNSQLTTLRKPWLVKMVGMVTYLGSAVVWAPVYALTFFLLKERFGSLIITILKVELIVLVIIITLRYLTRRERPSPYTTKLPFTLWNRYSFPSHHAARMFMLSIVIGTNYQESLLLMLFMAIIIGFTRIFLEKHYLSDVLAGAMVGILAATASLLIIGT